MYGRFCTGNSWGRQTTLPMPAPKWHFRRKQAGAVARDPISSEFFAAESVENAARAVIREAIQNSLDARAARGTAADIHIRLGVGPDALLPSQVAPFVSDAWPHLNASRNGLQDPPAVREKCPYLVVEDFGTRGLEGDVRAWQPERGASFYAFFRAEAFSDKAGDDRGRWGVGKLVFPRASRASMFFGYTVQASTKRALLMGRLILRHHDVDGKVYVPDAMFGNLEQIADDPEFVVPATSQPSLDEFLRTFKLRRGSEPGLSVVVPWLAEEEDYGTEQLVQAVVEEYLVPIIRGRLVVTVSSGADAERIDRSYLLRNPSGTFTENVAGLIRLAKFAADEPNPPTRTEPADQSNATHWPDQAFDDVTAKSLAERLEAGEPIAVEVPLRVSEKRGASRPASLRVYMTQADTADGVPPLFVRDEITVTDVRASKVPGIISLVTIDDNPLATLLGDAENPAHTDWRPNTRGFKDKYLYAKSYLNFVKDAPLALFRSIFAGEREDDAFALASFFPDNGAERSARGASSGEKRKGEDRKKVGKITRKPKRYACRNVQGGFEVVHASSEARMPSALRISAAYDVRRGDPFRRYERFDFDLSGSDIDVVVEGVRVLEKSLNTMVVEPTQEEFRVRVTGFDARRDLAVRVTAVEDHNGD